LLATFPSYEDALKIFNKAALSHERKVPALHLSYVMRSFATFRGHDELSDGWAAAGLLYNPGNDFNLPPEALKAAGANEGFLHLLTLQELPAMASSPTVSQELSCLLVTTAPLVHLITETMRVQNTAPKNLKVSAIQKRFTDKTFLRQLDRNLIRNGTQLLRWEIGNFTSKAIAAIRENESAIKSELKKGK
jgi:predicted hydrolase (HD superfamily)